jgi:hypothetical protein
LNSGAGLDAIEKDVASLLKTTPEIFDFRKIDAGFVEVRDFQTTGGRCIRQGLAVLGVACGQAVNQWAPRAGERGILTECQEGDGGLVAKL